MKVFSPLFFLGCGLTVLSLGIFIIKTEITDPMWGRPGIIFGGLITWTAICGLITLFVYWPK